MSGRSQKWLLQRLLAVGKAPTDRVWRLRNGWWAGRRRPRLGRIKPCVGPGGGGAGAWHDCGHQGFVHLWRPLLCPCAAGVSGVRFAMQHVGPITLQTHCAFVCGAKGGGGGADKDAGGWVLDRQHRFTRGGRPLANAQGSPAPAPGRLSCDARRPQDLVLAASFLSASFCRSSLGLITRSWFCCMKSAVSCAISPRVTAARVSSPGTSASRGAGGAASGGSRGSLWHEWRGFVLEN